MRQLIMIACLAGLLMGCLATAQHKPESELPDQEQVTITGEVFYRERMALAPGHQLSVKLLDTGPADTYSTVLDEYRMTTDGEQVPLPFSIRVNPARLDRLPAPTLRATLRDADGNLVWTTDTVHPVRSAGDSHRLMLVRAPGKTSENPAASSQLALTRHVWVLSAVINTDGGRVPMTGERPITLDFGGKGQVTGQADCNRIRGQYQADAGGTLTIRPLATTLMACPPPAEGAAYLSLIEQASEWSVENGKLTLSTGNGRVLIFHADSGDAATAAHQRDAVPAVEGFESVVRYQCRSQADQNDGVVIVGFKDHQATLLLPTGNTATADWQRQQLKRVHSASGARYQSEHWLFWTQGDEAQLDGPGFSERSCAVAGTPGTWERAAVRGVAFRAAGNEPGWYLELVPGKELLLVADYGEKRVSTVAAEPETTESGWRLAANSDSGKLSVRISKVDCTDSMKGDHYPLTVEVDLEGHRSYRGCGRWLLQTMGG